MRLFIVNTARVVTEAPPLIVRRAATECGEVVTVPIPASAQWALREAHASILQAVRVALAPYGLSPYDIAMPEFRRVVFKDEMTGRASG